MHERAVLVRGFEITRAKANRDCAVLNRFDNAENVRRMEAYALPLFRAGHLPVVGEWLALPLVALAGSRRVGDAAFDEIFHPIAERLLERCDAVLRVGCASQGADLMVQVARQRGLAVYSALQEIPGCEAETTRAPA